MTALSPEFLVAHADEIRFGLLSALLLFSRGWFVRLVVALLAGVELGTALATTGDRTAIIWMAVLAGLALLFLISGILMGRAARLSEEEQAMQQRLFKGIGRGRARHFFDQGYWLNGNAGEVLVREGEPVAQFCYLSEGEARVMMGGRAIGFCRSAEMVGGMAAFTGEPSAATVMLGSRARFWCAPADRLRDYLAAHPDLKRKIEKAMGECPPDDSDAPLPGREAVAAA